MNDIEGTDSQDETALLDSVLNEIEDKIDEKNATPEILHRKASRALSSD